MSLEIELLLRFLVGGFFVSAFAVVGDVLTPKRFAGIFGAAPSVALATLALSFALDGRQYGAVAGRSMALGAVALCVYSLLMKRLLGYAWLPAWMASGVAWLAWLVVTFGLWWVVLR